MQIEDKNESGNKKIEKIPKSNTKMDLKNKRQAQSLNTKISKVEDNKNQNYIKDFLYQ